MIDDDTMPLEDGGLLANLRNVLSPVLPRVGRWHGDSSKGRLREDNQDRFGDAGATVFVVADGMGGHAAGDLAAEAVVDAVRGVPSMMFDLGPEQFVLTVNAAVRTASHRAGVRRAGSTLVVLGVRAGRGTIINVGDSRAYRLRRGRLEQLTRDQNLGGLAAAADLLSREMKDDLLAAGSASDLVSFMGMEADELSIESSSVGLEEGDRFLLCSDGVHQQIDSESLRRVLDRGDCRLAVDELLRLADDAGGRDNATAVVVDIVEDRP